MNFNPTTCPDLKYLYSQKFVCRNFIILHKVHMYHIHTDIHYNILYTSGQHSHIVKVTNDHIIIIDREEVIADRILNHLL